MIRHRTLRRAPWFAAVVALFAGTASAAVLFPQPIHIVRTIEDPIAGTTVTIDEYCSGNRVVSIRGEDVVNILDYTTAELIEIDRTAATWSRTPFDQLANARPAHARATTTAPALRAMGTRSSPSGHTLEVFESADETGGVKRRIEVGVDRQVSLSRVALEALIGASYPAAHTGLHDVILAAAAGRRASAASTATAPAESELGLPAEIVVTFTVDGETLTARSSVVRTDSRTIPPGALLIPVGGTRVESRLLRFAKESDSLDHPKGVHR